MNQEKISYKQLFLIMLAFEIGSAIIFALGTFAGTEIKQDAWIAMLVGMLLGFILISVYSKLSGYYPEDSFIQIIRNVLGRYLGYPLCITYIFYFTYQAARITRDFAELILSTILVGTPTIVIMASFVFIIIHTLRGGLEVFGRMAELIFPIVLIIFFITWIIIISSGVVDLTQLKPVLVGDGLKNTWKEAFPYTVSLPFGELIAFAMIWPQVNESKRVKKVGLAVVLTTGIFLSLNIAGMITVLGSHSYSKLNYPLLSAVRMASVADFLERIDAVVILLMVAGGFFKVGTYIYAVAVGTAHLFKLKSYRSVLVPLGMIVTILGLVMAKNVVQLNEVKFIYSYIHIPLQFMIPSFLLFIAYIRKKRQTT